MSIKVKQHDVTDCGAACLASISAHYKLKLPIARIRQIAGTDQKGTNLLGMVKAAEKLGFIAKGVRAPKEALQEIPLPAVAHTIYKKKFQHYIVVYKTTDTHVTVMDPINGKLSKRSWSEFEEEWSGILMLIAPGESFEKGDHSIPLFSRFWALLKPHRRNLIQALLGAIVYTLLGLSTSIYIQKITDHVLINGNTNLLNLMSVTMIGLLAIMIFLGALKSIFVVRSGQMIDAQLILGYYKHLLKLPQRFFDTMRVGEIISRINDAVKIRAFINDVALNLIVNVFIIVFSFILMFSYHWKLAMIMAIIIPLYLVVYQLTNAFNKKRERQLMERSADLETQLVESINSIRTVKQLGLENFSNLKTEKRFITLLDTTYKSGMNSIFSTNSSEFISRLFTIILLWTGSYYVINQTITPGELLSFYAIIGYFTGPASSLIGMNKTIQNALIAADRLFEILDLEIEQDSEKMELKEGMLGDIRFQSVAFSYGTRKEVFESLNLTLPYGKITGIVGESGSGKSTLASLAQKLYPLNGGKVLIGDHDLEYLSLESLRARIGVVPQQLDLFAGSIIENIAVGDPKPDIERIVKISRDLGLISFIENLENGFATYVGEHGVNLSGGQRQRLAIARALYRNPDVLILDEATSSLDSASESFVQQTISKLREQGKTIIIIAHRLSTIMDADKIVVLENGKLIEEGDHQTLLLKDGKYCELWSKQFPAHVRQHLAA